MNRAVWLLAALILTGCSTGRHGAISMTSVGPSDQEEVIGIASASARVSYIPIFSGLCSLLTRQPCFIGDNSYEAVLKKALHNTKAHTLVNVYEDNYCTFYPIVFLFWLPCETRLTGTAIRYKHLTSENFIAEIRNPLPDRGRGNPEEPPRPNSGLDAMKLYDMLRSEHRESPDKATRFFSSLSPLDQRKIEGHVISGKGRSDPNRMQFHLDKPLHKTEREFVTWFLQRFSAFRPVLSEGE